MTLDLNISGSYPPKAQDTPYVRLSDNQADMEGLSLTEKETFNLAREAATGDSAWDKAILNLVHPPALSLYALLDSGRTVVPPPLPQVQEAYSNVEKATNGTDAQSGQITSKAVDSTKTGASDTKGVSTAAHSVSQTHTASVSTASATATATTASASQTIIA